MKKSLAVMLALIMVLCMIPTTALAANGTGHQISVKIYKVVLDSSKPLGYQNPELVNTITVICQDATGHSGYNHSVKLKEFYRLTSAFQLPTGPDGSLTLITLKEKTITPFIILQAVELMQRLT